MLSAVLRAASQEVRRQFREIAGILEGTGTPDYGRCVEISTRAAQHEMVIPSVLAIIIPIVVGILLGVAGVLGLKGLRTDPGKTRKNDSDYSMFKYAPSAAHVCGKPYTSSETFTWLTEGYVCVGLDGQWVVQ